MREKIEALIDAVRGEHAPDPRLVVFEVRVGRRDPDAWTIEGETSARAALDALRAHAPGRQGEVRVEVGLVRADRHAVVDSALAPVHARGSIRSTQVSQAPLGTSLRLLRLRGRWWHARFPDGYLGWIHQGYLRMVSGQEADDWHERARLVSLEAEVSREGVRICHLPWGSRVEEVGPHRVRLPDGEVAEIAGRTYRLSEQAGLFPPGGPAVVETAGLWIGTPYLWGGRSPAGVDCSGLVQLVFYTHGISLPRDSDQQAHVGSPVDPGPDLSSLRTGDLLFFSDRPTGRITHIALSEGGPRIIHASLENARVSRNDLSGSDAIDRLLRTRFRWARRVLG